MTARHRRLPHVYPEGKWLFLTWALHGSLPQARYPPPGKMSTGEAFVWMDRYMDTAQRGPMDLKRPEIAQVVFTSLKKGVELGHYELDAWVIMANHVHALLLPKIAPSRLMHSLKGTTAREANLLLGRTGAPFWQGESYDHWVRDEEELRRIARYIENNPVTAGIVTRPEEYGWSSAFARGTSAGMNPGRPRGRPGQSACAT